ncbi:MAG: hypothetical protein GXP05_03965, partial [Alphaproteobacteria bacterium]|nr:hypothetical protein [Alphaproteobacteria bacterium]
MDSCKPNSEPSAPVYTDTPTSIVASDRLSIYTGRNTILLGSAVYSEVGNLALDTGNLLFDDYDDSGTTGSVGVNISLDLQQFDKSDASGSLAYSNTQASPTPRPLSPSKLGLTQHHVYPPASLKHQRHPVGPAGHGA